MHDGYSSMQKWTDCLQSSRVFIRHRDYLQYACQSGIAEHGITLSRHVPKHALTTESIRSARGARFRTGCR